MVKFWLANKNKQIADVRPKGRIPVMVYQNTDYICLNQYFKNKSGFTDMNINGGTGGSINVNIWDGAGIDDIGTNDFTPTLKTNSDLLAETAGSMKNGTNGLDIDIVDELRFNYGPAKDISAASILKFWIQPRTGWTTTVDQLRLEVRDNNGRIGNRVDIQNYMATPALNVWQLVQIPLTDISVNPLSFSAVDEFRIGARGARKVFYMDDFKATSLAAVDINDTFFYVQPSLTEIYNIDSIVVAIESNSPVNGARISFNSDEFGSLGMLSAGVLLELQKDTKMQTVATFKNNFDLLCRSKNHNELIGETKTAVSFDLDCRITLSGKHKDKLKVSIRDNLTGLSGFKMVAFGNIENEVLQ